MAAKPDANAIATAFVKHYYTVFDTDRSKLQNLYQASSKLTFEGSQFQGGSAIIGKLQSLPFKKVQHAIKSVDCQPSGCGGLIVFVCGDLKVDDGENALKFAQVFHLMPDSSGSNYWVHNDVFRLNYG